MFLWQFKRKRKLIQKIDNNKRLWHGEIFIRNNIYFCEILKLKVQ